LGFGIGTAPENSRPSPPTRGRKKRKKKGARSQERKEAPIDSMKILSSRKKDRYAETRLQRLGGKRGEPGKKRKSRGRREK